MYDRKSNNCFLYAFLCRWEENPSRTRLLTRKPKWNPECTPLVQQCFIKWVSHTTPRLPFDKNVKVLSCVHLKRRAYQFHIFDLNIPAYNGRHTAQCTFHYSNTWQDSASFRIEIQQIRADSDTCQARYIFRQICKAAGIRATGMQVLQIPLDICKRLASRMYLHCNNQLGNKVFCNQRLGNLQDILMEENS